MESTQGLSFGGLGVFGLDCASAGKIQGLVELLGGFVSPFPRCSQ